MTDETTEQRIANLLRSFCFESSHKDFIRLALLESEPDDLLKLENKLAVFLDSSLKDERQKGEDIASPRPESPMPSSKLHPIDRQILAELQADGRMSNVELARRVGISTPLCLRRVRTLEEAGFIRGYHAEVEPRELGFEVQVFAMVGLSSQAEADLSAFEQRCRDWPLVRECHMLNGEIDFILKCISPDLSTFERFLTEELTAADNVANVKVSLVIRGAKNEPLVPFEVLEEIDALRFSANARDGF